MLREAQAAARLNHPGIVTLYEMGEEDGNALLVTELVDGDTLAQLNRDCALSDREIGEIGADLCEALDHAHCRAVVHRDIKPQNVLVTEDGEPRAKLMDFGVARLTDAAALTAPGDIVGTLAYMSPEQAEGRAAGPEADVYSLALMLYECWSGEHPTRRVDPGRHGARDRRPPPPPAAAPPRPAARAHRHGRRLPRRPARIDARRWRSWAARSRAHSTLSPSILRRADARCACASVQLPLAAAAGRLARRRSRRPAPVGFQPGFPATPSACLAREKEPTISVLRNLESRIEGLVEGVFSRAFSSEVQPVELARKLAKEMDAHKTAGVARVYVPNEYTVYPLQQGPRSSSRATSARWSRSSPATCSSTRGGATTTC